MSGDTTAKTENHREIHLEVLLSIDRGARDTRRVRFAILKDGANTDVPADAAQILQQLFASDLRVGQTVIEVIDHRYPSGLSTQPDLGIRYELTAAATDRAEQPETEADDSEQPEMEADFVAIALAERAQIRKQIDEARINTPLASSEPRTTAEADDANDPTDGENVPEWVPQFRADLEDGMAEFAPTAVITPPRPISKKPLLNPAGPIPPPRAVRGRAVLHTLSVRAKAGAEEEVTVEHQPAGRGLGEIVSGAVPERLHGANGVAVVIIGLGAIWALWGLLWGLA